MSDTVVRFPGRTMEDYEANSIVSDAAEQEWTGVVIMGWREGDDGETELYLSNLSNHRDALWLVERAKQIILQDFIDGQDH